MKIETIKKIFVVLGMLGLLGWLGIGDDTLGSLCLAFAIGVSLTAQLIEPPKEIVEKKVEAKEEVKPKKSKEEIEKEQLKARLAELEKPIKKEQKEEKEPKEELSEPPKTAVCPICQKECKNEYVLNIHLLSKHRDKAKIKLELE